MGVELACSIRKLQRYNEIFTFFGFMREGSFEDNCVEILLFSSDLELVKCLVGVFSFF
jgi:hypothetical protein